MRTPTRIADRSRLAFLDDYCPRCNPLGHLADSRVRLATLTEACELTAGRGRWAVCKYRCASCGHTWQRSDLWTAREAGFDPRRRTAA